MPLAEENNMIKLKFAVSMAMAIILLESAGTGSKVKVINETEVADAATLNTIAARKLAELTTDSAGLPISVPIWIGKSYALGQLRDDCYCSISAQWNLSKLSS